MDRDDGGARRRGVERLRRRALLRDVAVFQGKLLIDALKDLFLSPLSLVAGFLDIVNARPRRASRFGAIMNAGRDFERRLNLFGDPRSRHPDDRGWTVDDLVAGFETTLREQSGGGNAGATARAALDKTLATLGKNASSRDEAGKDGDES